MVSTNQTFTEGDRKKMATDTQAVAEFTTSFAQALLDTKYTQAVVAEVVGETVADQLFAPVVETLQSAEDAMVEALYQRYGGNDEAVRRGWIWQSAGFGTD